MANTNKELPIPSFYDPYHAAKMAYSPDLQALSEKAQAWRKQQGIAFAATDSRNIHFLGIDLQKDFCFPQGSLYVAGRSGNGAIEDNQRIAQFIYRNLGILTNITMTMDTHFAIQIFFASFWLDKSGNHPAPHTQISLETIRQDEVRPDPAVAGWLCKGNYAWLLKQVEFYCDELEKAGKYNLYLWPPHTILGSEGHVLAGVIQEARMFHSYVRAVQSWTEIKGGNPLTENYSVLRPEVLSRFDGNALAQKNTRFYQTLLEADALIIAGQAASHCVKSTIDDLLNEILVKDPNLVQKVYILKDCMSAVTVPDGKGGYWADFTDQADTALQRFAAAGMHIVQSSEPMAAWPGMGKVLG
jgi:nicotinamidase-related amidase